MKIAALIILMAISAYCNSLFLFFEKHDGRDKYGGPKKGLSMLKFWAVMPIVIAAFGMAHFYPSNYAWLVFAGLMICLAADMAIMHSFVAGLILFLAGHVAYIFAFGMGKPLVGSSLWCLAPYVTMGLLVYAILFPKLGKIMKVAVFIYVAVIVVMAWQSFDRMVSLVSMGSILAAWGALLFMVSDAILAIKRFRPEHRVSDVFELEERGDSIVMWTYGIAQWMIAYSILA